jgi:hypothetical protein
MKSWRLSTWAYPLISPILFHDHFLSCFPYFLGGGRVDGLAQVERWVRPDDLRVTDHLGGGNYGPGSDRHAGARIRPACLVLGRRSPLSIVDIFFFLLGYLFPNGLFVPRWTWVPALLTLVLIVPGNFFPGTILDVESWGVINLLLAPTAFAIMVLAQVYRYRRASTLVERQQTKWFVSGFAALVVVQSIHFSLVPALIPIQGTLSDIHRLILLMDYSLATISLLLIPIPIAIGILRYRLWDIDMLIRRTLIHGTLTGILAAVYFMNVIALQRILPARSQVSVVLSTLLIAALFTPLRRRIQNKIDRRFYQKKYDAGVITATFATTLRHEVDLETLSAALTSAIAEVMEPEHISLWMKDGRTGKLVQR